MSCPTLHFVPVETMRDAYRKVAIQYARRAQEETGEGLELSDVYLAHAVDEEARMIVESGKI